MSSIVLGPPNAIVFLMDPLNREVDVPGFIDGNLMGFTASCVAVGTQAPVDGDTEIILSDSRDAPDGLVRLGFFDIVLHHRVIAVVTSEFEVLLEREVGKDRVKVSVWVDDGKSPAKVFFGINQPVP